MDLAERFSFLSAELGRQEELFGRRRRRDKRKAFGLQISTVVFSGGITILLGLRVDSPVQRQFGNISLVLGALITVLSAIDAFFGHRHLWILRTVTLRQLQDLRRHVEMYLAGRSDAELDEQTLDMFASELDRIIIDDRQSWLRLRSSGPSPALMPPNGQR